MDNFNNIQPSMAYNEIYDDKMDAELLLFQLGQIHQQSHLINYNDDWFNNNEIFHNDNLTKFLNDINNDYYNDHDGSKFLNELHLQAQDRARFELDKSFMKSVDDNKRVGATYQSDIKTPQEYTNSDSFILEGTGTVLKIMKASELWLRHTRLDE